MRNLLKTKCDFRSKLIDRTHFAPVYDFGSKEIVAWSTSTRPDMAQQAELLDQLLERMPGGATPVLHSDSKNVASRFCGNRNEPYPAVGTASQHPDPHSD